MAMTLSPEPATNEKTLGRTGSIADLQSLKSALAVNSPMTNAYTRLRSERPTATTVNQ